MRISARDAVPFARAEGVSERVVEKVLQLLCLLTALNSYPGLRGKWALKGGTALNEDCRRALSAVLPFADNELAFLEVLLEQGEVDAGLLTCDTSLQQRIHCPCSAAVSASKPVTGDRGS